MGFGTFLGETWALYKRNLGWLIVAGIIAAVVSGALVLISGVIGGAVGYATFGSFSGGGSAGGISLAGALGGALVAMTVGLLVAQLLVIVLEGGMLKMAIDSGRSGRPGEIGELFAGFRRFPAYLVFGLIAQLAVPAGCLLVVVVVAKLAGPAVLLITPACAAFSIWLYVSWLYAVPLIADRGLGPIEALARSREMVSRVGWWSTFALLFVLGIAVWVIIYALSMVFGRGSVGGTPMVGVAEILIMPYVVCYVASMYLNSESTKAVPVYGSPPPGAGFDPYGSWQSSFAPLDPTGGVCAAPAGAPGGYNASAPPFAPASPPPPIAPGAPGGYVPPQPPPPPAPLQPDGAAEAAAWASAADPLAQRPPAPSEPAPAPSRAPGEPDPSWLSE